MNPSNHSADQGDIITRKWGGISWAWLFPILAASAAAWMFYSNWREEGPTVSVVFASAPGLHAGKTTLVYRGVVAGTVTSVELGPNLRKAVVTIRLKKFAQDLARSGTSFWIDQPVFSLTKTSGIQSLIDGNSLQAEMGTGTPTNSFVGLEQPPLSFHGTASLTVRLHAPVIPYVELGSEVTFRGLSVGLVQSKGLDEHQQPYIDIVFEEQYGNLVRSKARFWIVPPWSVKLGPGFLKLDVPSLKNFILGGIAFDYFSDRGEPVESVASFNLYDDIAAARAVSDPILLEFKNAQGILAGQTQLRFQGVPVGLVESVKPQEGKVLVTARLEQGYDLLRRKGSIFSITRPSIELPKITGLETIFSGVYIECIPGQGGGKADRFLGLAQQTLDALGNSEPGMEIVLKAPTSKISNGTGIVYRGVQVGVVLKKILSADGRSVSLLASIQRQYAPLLRENTKFWNISGVRISGGLISLNVQSAGRDSTVFSGIQFATPESPDQMGPRVKSGHVYELNDAPRKEWLQWAPSIPVSTGND